MVAEVPASKQVDLNTELYLHICQQPNWKIGYSPCKKKLLSVIYAISAGFMFHGLTGFHFLAEKNNKNVIFLRAISSSRFKDIQDLLLS